MLHGNEISTVTSGSFYQLRSLQVCACICICAFVYMSVHAEVIHNFAINMFNVQKATHYALGQGCLICKHP